MTAAMSGLPPAGGWTTDDLDALPEDGIRRELIDGVVQFSPAPSAFHQFFAAALMMGLNAACPRSMAVTQAVEIRLNTRRSFIPDVVVLNAEAARRTPGPFAPHEVVLAIEIVSPTSQAMDRVTKPALYAKAGIPFFWRVETSNGISVSTYKIDPEDEVYQPYGTYTEVIKADEPWPIEIPIAGLIPPYLSDWA